MSISINNLFTHQQLHTYIEQFTKQSNEITNNPLRAADINNKLVINAVDVARDNLKIYKRTVDAVTEFATISQRSVDKI